MTEFAAKLATGQDFGRVEYLTDADLSVLFNTAPQTLQLRTKHW